MGQSRIDPITTSENIRETYLRYLTTTFGLKNSELAKQFRELARHTTGLFRGPILEATPKYRKGKSLLDLVTDPHSILSNQFLNYAPGLGDKKVNQCLPLERDLYAHQQNALQKICGENRNVVVATGTGSGKTECFLLPIIDHLLRERDANKLGPGVRAVLIYPMNALANDQVARLRKLLPPETGITFGRYTGQTKQTYRQGLDAFQQENNKVPQANELFCRDQILGNEPEGKKEWPHSNYEPFVGPPHILLTNFAMLEYLLLRPQDSALFDGPNGDTWRFLVLDEAHIYTGAQGSEISYLMRRLKDRVCLSMPGKLLCIATSATIGATDKSSLEDIADSFKNLFGEPFEQKDVITGDVVPLEEFVAGYDEWGAGSSDFYQGLSRILDQDYSDVSSLVKSLREWELFKKKSGSDAKGWPDQRTCEKCIQAIVHIDNTLRAKEILAFYLLAGDRRVRTLINLIELCPTDLPKVAEKIWSTSSIEYDLDAAQRNLITLVDLASRAKLEEEGASLLSARYHFFVRSLEGLSVFFEASSQADKSKTTPKLLAGRHHEVPNAMGGSLVAFELLACGRCGQPYLRGCLGSDGRLISFARRTRLDEQPIANDIYSIDLEKVVESAEDEDPLRDEKAPAAGMPEENEDIETSKQTKTGQTLISDLQFLCSKCGYLADMDSHACPYCKKYFQRISNAWVEVRKVIPAKGKTIKVCPACGAQKYYGGSILRTFSPGDDAAGAVIGQCLLSNIPESSESEDQIAKADAEKKNTGRFSKLVVAAKPQIHKGKRRLLAFSDSRQDAAYFATYMNRTSNQILHRQLIVGAAKRFLSQNSIIDCFDINDLKNPLIDVAQEVGLFSAKDTEGTKTLEVCKWLNGELANIQRRQGLEGVGLLGWDLKCTKLLYSLAQNEEEGLKQDYNLSAQEFVTLLKIFLTELRQQNVLQPIINVRIQDNYFWPRNRPYTIRPNNVNSKLSIASWHPQAARNMRSDFIERVFTREGIEFKPAKIENLLKDLWEISNAGELEIWEEVPSVKKLWNGIGGGEAAWRLRWDAWIGHLNRSSDVTIYKCDMCGTVSPFNLKGVCPSYRCPGTLQSINPDEEFTDNHYRHLYLKAKPISILSLEHTAQITNQEGAERQNSFTNDYDPLNVLSCSTTFELGVDVGQLHSVFLRNVPPSVANYVQRAGRAGRRWSAAAYVLTFCRSRPHDISHFLDVEQLIAGKVQPPRIQIDNHRIARRHLHAVVLSRFWRFYHPEYFDGPDGKRRGIVDWFFFNDHQTGAEAVYQWLQSHPDELDEEIFRIFPKSIASELGFESWKWVSELVAQPKDESPAVWEGSLGLTQSELLSEHRAYEELKKTNPKLFYHADKQIKRLREKQLLGLLASRNVIPKYGFPVDVVSLKIESKDEWAQKVELDRDLKIALSEYAPGCTLVANGKIIRSYALERIAGKAWPEYQYAVCGQCGKFHRSETSQDSTPDRCECGQTLDETDDYELRGKFVEPSFGFRTLLNEDGQDPVEVRPQRTFSTRVFFSHYRVAPTTSPFTFEGNPDPEAGIRIQKRYSRYGVLTVINPGRSKRGFWLCPLCGYGDSVAGGKPENHKTPWGAVCKGTPKCVALGHEFQSDVLELRFSGGLAENSDQGFWLSLTSALLAGAAKALDIERDDIDGTVLAYGGSGYRAIVLFDSVPGGAGHVRSIFNALQPVIKAAFEITESCTGCSRDQSCSGCLRNYRNQYAHDLLKRGQAADFLRNALASLYKGKSDGFIPLGLTDAALWLTQQMKRADRLDLILEALPVFGREPSSYATDLSKVLYEVALKGSNIHLYLRKTQINEAQKDSCLKASLHALTLLTELGHVTVNLLDEKDNIKAPLYLEIESEAFAFRWPKGTNPFAGGKEVEFSTHDKFTSSVKGQLDLLNKSSSCEKWNLEKLEKLLEGTKIIRINEGEKKDWKDLLYNYLPRDIERVEIYDRFLRNRYQLKSLQMLLDVLLIDMSDDSLSVKITTTSEEPQIVKEQLKSIQDYYAKKGLQLDPKVYEPAKELPHYRRVLIYGRTKKLSIWMDKGLDIYWFDDLKKPSFKTIESYIVIENIK